MRTLIGRAGPLRIYLPDRPERCWPSAASDVGPERVRTTRQSTPATPRATAHGGVDTPRRQGVML